ncbi:hypothetical protein Ahy_B06g082571 [Arachis hypogaea]|uniref:At2g35280-like TPR domain-containing protein n=1 Tax=Arachis hypogaea TaxID=3818 RepID=A0A444YNS3_ARAHY|nr:hypothetical protein Ahy_B06g082571 [Arachis hypogaea]
MDGPSNSDQNGRRGRKKVKVSAQYECLLNFLHRDLWARIASKVASGSIRDLLNMQVTCKVFVDVASSPVVYKSASISDVPIASYPYYFYWPAKRFIGRCADAGNPATLFRAGMMDFIWIGCFIVGMETLTTAATAGDDEARYMFAMVLLAHGNEGVEHHHSGLEFYSMVCAVGGTRNVQNGLQDGIRATVGGGEAVGS